MVYTEGSSPRSGMPLAADASGRAVPACEERIWPAQLIDSEHTCSRASLIQAELLPRNASLPPQQVGGEAARVLHLRQHVGRSCV